MITQNRRAITPPEALKWLIALGWEVVMEDRDISVLVLLHPGTQQLLMVGSEDWGILRARTLPEAARKLGAP